MTEIRVTVDQDLCAAAATCQRIAPAIFQVPDDEDWAHVLLPILTDPDQVSLAREAEDACPTGAIILEEQS